MLNQLRDSIHAANVEAGWWSDLNTGESILATRNRPEMLMLTVRELSEAHEAFEAEANDDKLTHLPGFDVEIADAAIRLFDQAGGDGIDLDQPTDFVYLLPANKCDHNFELMVVVNRLSMAMEGYRKNNTELYHRSIREAIYLLIAIAKGWDFDLFDVIEQKLAYNAQRADHKIENRLKADGKRF